MCPKKWFFAENALANGIPALLDEVHWLVENRGLHFALCGSSARKVKRGAANLLGGRATIADTRYDHPTEFGSWGHLFSPVQNTHGSRGYSPPIPAQRQALTSAERGAPSAERALCSLCPNYR